MPADPREVCAFGARLENRSVFILDPRLGAVVALKHLLYYNRAYSLLPDCKTALRIYQERG